MRTINLHLDEVCHVKAVSWLGNKVEIKLRGRRKDDYSAVSSFVIIHIGIWDIPWLIRRLVAPLFNFKKEAEKLIKEASEAAAE